MAIINVQDVSKSFGPKLALDHVTLDIPEGKIFGLLGPNGAGKSTLSGVLAGKPGYTVTEGDALLDGESLLDLSPEERSWKGVFLGFQYPVEIPGVSNTARRRVCRSSPAQSSSS